MVTNSRQRSFATFRLFAYLPLLAIVFASFPIVIFSQDVRSGAVKRTTSKAVRNAKNKKLSGNSITGASVSDDDEIDGITTQGPPGITETVADIMERERKRPKKPFDPNRVDEGVEHQPFRPNKKQPPWAMDNLFGTSFEQLESTMFLPQTLGTSIAGPGRTSDGINSIPPDSVGDVGPTQVLMLANGRIKVYDKFTGALGSLDALDTTFWNSVRNGVGVSDPRVEYDRLSQRWILCMINVSATLNRVMIAVSSGPTITNSASFTFFQMTTATQFLDYPTLGADANAVYIGGNIFTTGSAGGTFASTRGYVVNKANLLSGTLTVTTFNNIGTAAVGPYTPQGVSNDDPAATEGYFIGVDTNLYSLLQLRRVSTPGGTPTISANIPISVATTTAPIQQEHQGRVASRGNTRFLDALDDRLFQAQITRDNITGQSTLWTAHNFEVNTLGAATTGGGRNGSRWYQIDNLTTVPTVAQTGTLFDSAATNPNGYWIPSVALSGQGHMAIGASSAGVNRRAELWAAGRLRTDTASATQAPTQIQSSSTAYNLQTVATQRWGDYSKTSVDPCDNQSFWHFGEYADLTNSWRMRAVQLLAAPPPATVTALPSSGSTTVASTIVIVSGVSVAGTEFYDNPAGFFCSPSCNTTGTGTCHIAASVTSSPGTPLTFNSINFNTPTQVTLDINAVTASAGVHAIQLTNPDGQSTSFTFELFAPSAAMVSISGRVAQASGMGIRGAVVSAVDNLGNVRTGVTNAFGYYRIEGVDAGRSYTLTARAKGFEFQPQLLSVQEDLDGINFIAQ